MPYKKRKQYRWPLWNYSTPHDYFITICTAKRAAHFGEVVLKLHGEVAVKLAPCGFIAKACLMDLLHTYPHIDIPCLQFMPDHAHFILRLGFVPDMADELPRGLMPLPPNSVSSVVNHYKGAVTKACRAQGFAAFEWQSRFYDRVIRDDEEYGRIAEYIDTNPERWLRSRGLIG